MPAVLVADESHRVGATRPLALAHTLGNAASRLLIRSDRYTKRRLGYIDEALSLIPVRPNPGSDRRVPVELFGRQTTRPWERSVGFGRFLKRTVHPTVPHGSLFNPKSVL
jgi:hypothetical protein